MRIEAHTDLKVPLGTVEVRQYLGERSMSQASLALDAGSLSPTTGPENRYSAVLFVEKEGFNALLVQAREHVHDGRTAPARSPRPSH